MDFRNMSKSRTFRWKNKAKPSQSTQFAIFFSKNHCIYLKIKNTNIFSIVKIYIMPKKEDKKVPLEICQKVVSLDLKTALSTFHS